MPSKPKKPLKFDEIKNYLFVHYPHSTPFSPHVPLLSKKFGISERRVYAVLNELVKTGVITQSKYGHIYAFTLSGRIELFDYIDTYTFLPHFL